MGRPRKKAQDLTTEEAMRRLFPAKVIRLAKKEAEKSETKPRKPSKDQG
jgi:hypothetical protein